jgi:hypothetical protein
MTRLRCTRRLPEEGRDDRALGPEFVEQTDQLVVDIS